MTEGLRAPPEGENWFQLLLESAPDAIVGVDDRGLIVVVNAETERMFGYARAELLESPIEILVPESLREAHVEDRQRYFANATTRPMAAGKNLTGRRKDGSVFPVEISLSPVRAPHGILVMSVVRDVTDRKEAERRELTMLRALATIGESAAILAHEIKNPVTAINAALKSVGARLGLADRDILDDLVERMRRLEMMIRRTLSFVKPIELHRKPCLVGDLFEHAVADSRGPLAGKQIAIVKKVAGGLTCDVDPQLMREVLANLVTNAAEAMDAGTVVLQAEAAEDGGVVLTIEDDGPGMPSTMRGKPIQPFVTSKRTGTGLGLTICRKIVEEHGGSIGLFPVDPHGTRVRIEIPRRNG
jgi:two-component system, LuxR family, sensor kinase FixL